MTSQVNTEQRILNAARKVFTQKGMAAARMQEVAEEAGINKALLHYYFKDKQHLFEGVFKESAQRQFGCIWDSLKQCDCLFPAIEAFVTAYLDRIIEEPMLPLFIANELNRDAKGLADFVDRPGRRAVRASCTWWKKPARTARSSTSIHASCW